MQKHQWEVWYRSSHSGTLIQSSFSKTLYTEIELFVALTEAIEFTSSIYWCEGLKKD